MKKNERKIWDTWPGTVVTNGHELFISTKNADWSHRLRIWKDNTYQDSSCPAPMPVGHIMFRNKGTGHYKVVRAD